MAFFILFILDDGFGREKNKKKEDEFELRLWFLN